MAVELIDFDDGMVIGLFDENFLIMNWFTNCLCINTQSFSNV